MKPPNSTQTPSYSIPQETLKVFRNGILNNPLIAHMLPEDITQCASTVHFTGTDQPSLPINWRFAESISALKGLEAAMTNVLLKRKYNLEPQEAVINTHVYSNPPLAPINTNTFPQRPRPTLPHIPPPQHPGPQRRSPKLHNPNLIPQRPRIL